MRVIPEGEREDYAEYAWMLSCQGSSTRLIAEQIFAERGVKISHVTVAALIREAEAQVPTVSRMQAVRFLHAANLYHLSDLYQERRIGAASTVDIAPHVGKVLDRLARLHGANAPTLSVISDHRELPAPDPETDRAITAMEERSAREVSDLRAGTHDGEDPTP